MKLLFISYLSGLMPVGFGTAGPTILWKLPDPVAGLHGADPSAHLDKSYRMLFFLTQPK